MKEPSEKIKLWWDDPITGQRHELTSTLPVTVGREAGNKLKLDHTEVSRQHAEIVAEGDNIVIRDISSTNGLLVNGKLVQEAVLGQGDRFKIGPYDFNWGFDFPPERPDDLTATVIEPPEEKTDILPPPGWRKEIGDNS
ncbi:MAG: FHA domain-containing protein [Anaerolineae bacterium]|nr:FHA domain-containing protein [Anaerolineae bacterium]